MSPANVRSKGRNVRLDVSQGIDTKAEKSDINQVRQYNFELTPLELKMIKIIQTLLAVLVATIMTASAIQAEPRKPKFTPITKLKIKPAPASADPETSLKESLKKIRDATLQDSRSAAAASASSRLSDPSANARAIEEATKATDAQRKAASDKFERLSDAERRKLCLDLVIPASECLQTF